MLAEKLTIVVVTRNRAAFMRRLLVYLEAAGMAVPMIIADSSDDPDFSATAELVRAAPRLEATHRRYPRDWSNFRCLAEVCEIVETPYVVWNSDDDFLIPDALESSVRFLETHADHSLVHGDAVLFGVQGDAVHGPVVFIERSQQRTIDAATAVGRLRAQLRAYTSTAYSVHRTKQLAESYRLVIEGGLDGWFGELFASCLPMAYGKVHKLDTLFMARQTHAGMDSRRKPHPFRWISDSAWPPRWAFVRARLGAAIAAVDGVSHEAAIAAFDDAFILYIDRAFAHVGRAPRPDAGRSGVLRVARAVPGARAVLSAVRAGWRGEREMSLPAMRRGTSWFAREFATVLRTVEGRA